uniref:Uncharacterized protein n=1 Tax=Sphingobacterium sp. (strain 21) TaxID=743722 RepID=F4C1L9_SPHS2
MLFILGSLQISKLLRLDIHTTNNCNNFVIYKACKWLPRKNKSNHLINNTLNIVNGLLTSRKNDKSNEKFLTFGKKEHRSIKNGGACPFVLFNRNKNNHSYSFNVNNYDYSLTTIKFKS